MKNTKFLAAAGFISMLFSLNANGQTLIKCQLDDDPKVTLLPAPYISKGNLCFDVRGLTDFAGRNCVKPGGEARWSAFTDVSVDGTSLGKDFTQFRVAKPVITSSVLEYTIEWARSMEWETMQQVKINRLTGKAVSYFVEMHGGDSYTCKLEQPKL